MSASADFDIHHDDFGQILREDSAVHRLATGFGFTEGPAWVPARGCLLFSDIPGNEMWCWSAAEVVHSWRAPSHHANGNTVDPQGRLLTCEHGSRHLTRTDPDGTVTILASTYRGKLLNSPNDVVVKSDATIWFTDPPYGIDASLIEQPANYVFRLDPGASEPVALTDDLAMPNGLCFSPNERLLYVADSSERAHIRRFAVNADNTLSGGEVFATISAGVPDGIRVDQVGRLFSTAADGVHVFAPDGTLLGRILVPEVSANCTFGGPEGDTLFITASTSLYAVRLATRAPSH